MRALLAREQAERRHFQLLFGVMVAVVLIGWAFVLGGFLEGTSGDESGPLEPPQSVFDFPGG